MDTSNLHGRTVLVTGAGSGIGRETALLAARRGADLALCDVDDAGLAEVETSARALGRGVLARHVDVADREQMRDFAEAVHARGRRGRPARQQRRRRPGGAASSTPSSRTGTGSSRSISWASSTAASSSCRRWSSAGRAVTSRTSRRWPASMRARRSSPTRPRSSRCWASARRCAKSSDPTASG